MCVHDPESITLFYRDIQGHWAYLLAILHQPHASSSQTISGQASLCTAGALFLGWILDSAGLFVSGQGLGGAFCWLVGPEWPWLGSLAGDGINGNDSDGLVAQRKQ